MESEYYGLLKTPLKKAYKLLGKIVSLKRV